MIPGRTGVESARCKHPPNSNAAAGFFSGSVVPMRISIEKQSRQIVGSLIKTVSKWLSWYGCGLDYSRDQRKLYAFALVESHGRMPGPPPYSSGSFFPRVKSDNAVIAST